MQDLAPQSTTQGVGSGDASVSVGPAVQPKLVTIVRDRDPNAFLGMEIEVYTNMVRRLNHSAVGFACVAWWPCPAGLCAAQLQRYACVSFLVLHDCALGWVRALPPVGVNKMPCVLIVCRDQGGEMEARGETWDLRRINAFGFACAYCRDHCRRHHHCREQRRVGSSTPQEELPSIACRAQDFKGASLHSRDSCTKLRQHSIYRLKSPR